MPRPGYIVCSAAGAVDLYTNFVSCHNLMEIVEIVRIRPEEGSPPPASRPVVMRAIAMWIQEAEDAPEQSFEGQLVAFFPGLAEEVILADFEPFSFKGPVHRLIVTDLTISNFFGPGILRLECRIRRAGEATWLAQQGYSLFLKEQFPEPPASPSPQQPAGTLALPPGN